MERIGSNQASLIQLSTLQRHWRIAEIATGLTQSKSITIRKKSISPPHLWGVDYIIPQPMKRFISPPELSKTGQITPIK